VTVNITIKYSLLAERNLRLVPYVSKVQVVTCHALKQVKCTHFLHASTTLRQQHYLNRKLRSTQVSAGR